MIRPALEGPSQPDLHLIRASQAILFDIVDMAGVLTLYVALLAQCHDIYTHTLLVVLKSQRCIESKFASVFTF